MRKYLVILLVFAMTILAGCGNKQVDQKELRYDREMKSIISVEDYKEVFEDIITYRDYDETAKLLVREKYQNVVRPYVFDQLDGLSNSMKLVYPGITSNTMEIKKDGEYPVFNDRFDIKYYGEYDEYIESIEEFYKHDMNTIENIEATNDKIIVKVNNKYNGIYYIYAYTVNGEITYINILS